VVYVLWVPRANSSRGLGCVKIDRRLGVNIPYAFLKDEGL